MNTPAQFFLSIFRSVGFSKPVTDYSFNGLKSAYHDLTATNNGEQSLAFVQAAFKELKTLADLLQRQPYAVVGTLQVFCVGLEMENSQTTIIWTCRILSRLIASLRSNNTPPATLIEVYQWLMDKNGPFNIIFNLMQSQPRLRPSLFAVMEQIGLVDLNELITTILLDRISDRQQYFTFVGSFVNFLTLNPFSCKILDEANFPMNMSQFIAATIDKSVAHETKIAAIALLIHICLVYSRNEIDVICVNILKKGCHDRSVPLRVQSIAGLFSILEKRLETQSPMAADIYKFLIFAMIEHHAEHIRPYIQRSMANFIETHPKFPVNIMVEPFFKTLSLHSFDNLDFDLIFSITKHPQLDVKHSKAISNFLFRIALYDEIYSRLATLPLVVLINRFNSETLDDLSGLFEKAVSKFGTSEGANMSVVAEVLAKLLNLKIIQLDPCISRCIDKMNSVSPDHPSVIALSNIYDETHK